MHLAIVSPYPPNVTGIGQYGYHLSRVLAQSGSFTRITILTGTPGNAEPIRMPAPICIEYAWQPEQLDAGWRITTHLRHLKPDLVWFNLGTSIFGRSPLANLSGFLAPAWTHQAGFPTIVTLHELAELADLPALNAPGGPFARYGARLLTYIATTQSDVVCLTMRRYVDWLSGRHPRLQCRHIPIGAYNTPEMLEESGPPELLFFTTLAPFKGLEVLLEAFQSLQTDYPNLRMTIAGPDHARFPGYGRALRKKFGGLTGIRWLGQVHEDNVRELFRRAQLVVLPYNASTGSSSVVYQAASWGRPVVASNLPETQAIARESGLEVALFQRRQAASLATVLRTYLDSTQQRRAQVEHNFAAIQRNRPEATCRAYLQAFNLALESRRSPKRIIIPAQIPSESV